MTTITVTEDDIGTLKASGLIKAPPAPKQLTLEEYLRDNLQVLDGDGNHVPLLDYRLRVKAAGDGRVGLKIQPLAQDGEVLECVVHNNRCVPQPPDPGENEEAATA